MGDHRIYETIKPSNPGTESRQPSVYWNTGRTRFKISARSAYSERKWGRCGFCRFAIRPYAAVPVQRTFQVLSRFLCGIPWLCSRSQVDRQPSQPASVCSRRWYAFAAACGRCAIRRASRLPDKASAASNALCLSKRVPFRHSPSCQDSMPCSMMIPASTIPMPTPAMSRCQRSGCGAVCRDQPGGQAGVGLAAEYRPAVRVAVIIRSPPAEPLRLHQHAVLRRTAPLDVAQERLADRLQQLWAYGRVRCGDRVGEAQQVGQVGG